MHRLLQWNSKDEQNNNIQVIQLCVKINCFYRINCYYSHLCFKRNFHLYFHSSVFFFFLMLDTVQHGISINPFSVRGPISASDLLVSLLWLQNVMRRSLGSEQWWVTATSNVNHMGRGKGNPVVVSISWVRTPQTYRHIEMCNERQPVLKLAFRNHFLVTIKGRKCNFERWDLDETCLVKFIQSWIGIS